MDQKVAAGGARCPVIQPFRKVKSQNMELVIAPGYSRGNHALSKPCGSRFYFPELV